MAGTLIAVEGLKAWQGLVNPARRAVPCGASVARVSVRAVLILIGEACSDHCTRNVPVDPISNQNRPRGTATAAPGADPRLDQERDNRKRTIKGTYVGSPWDGVEAPRLVGRLARSGGAFDPLGVRAADVARGSDVVAMVTSCPGRWLLISLTINRELFIGPEAAYQRANEYVRKAIASGCPKGIWFAAVELQGKTGDGWPHWHVLAYCPDSRSPDQVKAHVLRAWRTRTPHFDPETGEVSSWSSESIGFVDVEEVESAKGAGTYAAKYVVKPWPAVAPWMLASTCRFRKFRLSNLAYAVLEKLHRHEVHRGRRRPPAEREHRPRVRTLLDRMADSASKLQVFELADDGTLAYRCTVPISADQADERLPVVRGSGEPRRKRWYGVPGWVLLRRDSFRLASGQFRSRQRQRIAAEWKQYQEFREYEESLKQHIFGGASHEPSSSDGVDDLDGSKPSAASSGHGSHRQSAGRRTLEHAG